MSAERDLKLEVLVALARAYRPTRADIGDDEAIRHRLSTLCHEIEDYASLAARPAPEPLDREGLTRAMSALRNSDDPMGLLTFDRKAAADIVADAYEAGRG